MKLETRNKRHSIHRAVLQVVAMLGLPGVAPSVSADDLASLADPTQPAYSIAATGVVVSKPTGPALQSTFISASQRRAVISGKSYTVGDKFGGGTITDIQPYEVVLKKVDRETRLRLLPKLAKEAYMVKVPASSQEGGNHK